MFAWLPLFLSLLAFAQPAQAGLRKGASEDWVGPWNPVGDEDYTCSLQFFKGKSCRVCVLFETADKEGESQAMLNLAAIVKKTYASDWDDGQKYTIAAPAFLPMRPKAINGKTYDHKVCSEVKFGPATKVPTELWFGPHHPQPTSAKDLKKGKDWDCLGDVLLGKHCWLCAAAKKGETSEQARARIKALTDTWENDYHEGAVRTEFFTFTTLKKPVTDHGATFDAKACSLVSFPGAKKHPRKPGEDPALTADPAADGTGTDAK